MTNEAIEVRDKLLKLANSYGVDSLRKLSIGAGVNNQNLYSNINGRFDISIKRMFKLANFMGCDITEVIEVFHPDLYAENQRIVAEKLKSL